VYCPSCGSAIDDLPCPVCGAVGFTRRDNGGGDYAGWWRRVGATVVDSLLLLIPIMAISGAIGTHRSVLQTLASIAIQGAYEVYLLARPRGQTIGNRLVRTVVRDEATRGQITVGQAQRRWGAVALYNLIALFATPAATSIVVGLALVDVTYPLFNARKQTWHDRLAGTVVLRS
jgi:uncharacterized RDD family membrane protein YckC